MGIKNLWQIQGIRGLKQKPPSPIRTREGERIQKAADSFTIIPASFATLGI
jgi:hypothetical protein